jgi:hypothetical protein
MFDVLTVGIMANFLDITPMPYSIILFVKDVEGIVR